MLCTTEIYNSINELRIQGILESTRRLAENRVKGKPEIIWEFLAMKSTFKMARYSRHRWAVTNIVFKFVRGPFNFLL